MTIEQPVREADEWEIAAGELKKSKAQLARMLREEKRPEARELRRLKAQLAAIVKPERLERPVYTVKRRTTGLPGATWALIGFFVIGYWVSSGGRYRPWDSLFGPLHVFGGVLVLFGFVVLPVVAAVAYLWRKISK
jgi:hypothetical protein